MSRVPFCGDFVPGAILAMIFGLALGLPVGLFSEELTTGELTDCNSLVVLRSLVGGLTVTSLDGGASVLSLMRASSLALYTQHIITSSSQPHNITCCWSLALCPEKPPLGLSCGSFH